MTEAERILVGSVEWESPAPPANVKYDWQSIAEQLRERPGEWAKVFEKDRVSLVNALRQSKMNALLPSDGFEILTRNNVRASGPARTCTLYMRWTPPKKKGRK
jgi:hypothetical protein